MKKWIKRESSNPLEHLNFILFYIEKIIKEITNICPSSLFFSPTLYTPYILSLQTHLHSETNCHYHFLTLKKMSFIRTMEIIITKKDTPLYTLERRNHNHLITGSIVIYTDKINYLFGLLSFWHLNSFTACRLYDEQNFLRRLLSFPYP